MRPRRYVLRYELGRFKHVYPIRQNFCVGHADYAFDGVRYPDGVKARGSIWPFGLYICPKTHRFFAFFHNETGWRCRGTEYDAFGSCETLSRDSRYINPFESGHYNNDGMDKIGQETGETLAALR